MQKTKILCLILAMVLASAGTAGIVMDLGGESVVPTPPDNSVNTVLDKPAEGLPTDRTAIENLFIAQGELLRKGSFVGTTRGWTASAGIKQEVVNNRVVINGNVFKEMITCGVVKNAYQLYMYGDNYLYRKSDSIKSSSDVKWSNTASKYSEADFLQKFGHRSDSLTGYILNEDTVVSGTLVNEENGLFTYRYVLDVNTAPANMLLEMRTNSNMSGYSTFSKAEIVVVMDSNWQVKTLTTDCKYKVPMFGGVDCVEDITETFSDVTSQDLPEKEFFEQFFDADVTTPIEKEPDALSILMDMFAPYIGNGSSLNASVAVLDNGQTLLNGLVSAKIDIDNIQNIEVAAKLGDELYVEYAQDKVFVTYQDFKASTTVDGIMGVVNAFMPQASLTEDVADEDADSDILSKFTYAIADGVCTVSLPLELGEEQIDINIYANVVEDGYKFINAQVTLGTLTVTIELADGFDVPARSGEYPEILGLLDLVQNGAIYGNVSALGMDFDVMFDLSAMSLYAANDDLSVIYQNETIYAEYGAIKAKLNVNDIDRIMTLLRLSGIVDGDTSFELPQITVEQVIALVANITASATDGGVAFSLDWNDLSVAIYLVAGDNGWNIDSIVVNFDGNVITLALSAPFEEEVPEIVDNQYADVMEILSQFINPITSLASAKSYGAEFDLDVAIGGNRYNVKGGFNYDGNGNIALNAVIANDSATLLKANVVVADGVVYLDVNGVKAAFTTDGSMSNVDLSQILKEAYGVNEHLDNAIDTVYEVINSTESIDVAKIDFSNLISRFSFENGVLGVTINADFIGLNKIDVQLTTGKFNNIVVSLGGVKLGDIELEAQATITSNVSKVKAPNADDYILNLQGNVEGIEFAVSADLLNMDISASINVLDQTVLLRYVNGKIYATVGEVAVVGTLDKLADLVAEIVSNIGADMPTIDLDSFSNLELSLQSILKSISIGVDEVLCVDVKLDDFATVSIDFDKDGNLAEINANVMGYVAQVEKSDKRVPQLNVGNTYIPVEELTKHIVAIYNNFKDVAITGIVANIVTTINVKGVAYNLVATLNYNNGVYLNASIADKNNALIALEMYFVNNAIYLDINGIRVASELDMQEVTDNANIDLATVMGMLAQAKGYNDVLDSVIATVEQLPSRLENINYLDLISALTYDNDVLTGSINGELLGMSKFEVTLAGTNDVTLTLSNLVIGSVAIESFTVNATPACDEVTAPDSDYVTELELEVMGLTFTAKLDLYNKTLVATTILLDHELALYYVNNTVYVNYGAVNAKLNIADIDKLIAAVSELISLDMPEFTMPELDVKQILNGISKLVDSDGYSINANIDGISVALKFDSNAKFTQASVKVNDIDVSATLVNGASYPIFDINANYVDLVEVVETFANGVRNVIDAEGYDISLNGNLAVEGNLYTVDANVIYNNGLYVNANVFYNKATVLSVELWYVDNTLYVSAGTLKLAIALPASSADTKIDLAQFKGYNDCIDGVLDVIPNVIDKLMSGDVDYISMVAGLSFANGELNLNINGEQLGLSNILVTLNANKNLTASVDGLTLDKVAVNLTAGLKASANSVIAPSGDFTTNLSIKIDEKNIIYANLDLLNGVYNFRLDDLYVMYSDNTVKINKGSMYVSGDINAIIDYIKRIDDLVNEFSGATESTIGFSLSSFSNIDIKAIVKSLTIASSEEKITIGAKAFGTNVTVTLAYGKLHTITVPVSLIDKTLQIETCTAQTFDKFNGEIDYVAIDQIFDDYFPVFEKLVHTNSWKFSFDGDTLLTLKNSNYMVAQGSYFEFYYKNTEGLSTLKLRAKLDVRKQKDDGSWQQYMLLDIVYKDGNIYVTDTGRKIDGKDTRNSIKITVSIDTLVKCYELYDKIVAVVPQIGELVDNMLNAMAEAEKNAESLSYATVLSDLWYSDSKVFGLTLNGAALLSKLGEVTLSAQTYGDGLSLDDLELHYDGISVKVSNLRVTASDLVEVDGATEYATVQDIESYDTTGHMDFNSLYELLSAFVETATPIEGTDTRSFYIDGTALVSLKIRNWDLADIPIGLSVRVDINEDNKVYISAKITRTQPEGALLNTANFFGIKVYEDKGGDSYLYYDGVNETFTVIRNSIIDWKHTVQEQQYKWHCTKCDKDTILNAEWCTGMTGLSTHGTKYLVEVPNGFKDVEVTEKNYYYERHFAAENVSSADFTANIMDYIMEMFNFGSMIKDPIVEAINKENTNDFGIEDILTNYSYSEEQKTFAVNADLTAIDSNLGAVDVSIVHNDQFSLTNLKVNAGLLNGMCQASVPFELKESTYGYATQIVKETIFW